MTSETAVLPARGASLRERLAMHKLPHFRDEALPRLARLGVRETVP